MATQITIHTDINAPIEKVWEQYTEPAHVMHWNNASDDWHTPRAENDLRVGGTFMYRMEAKDGSAGFDFSGTYEQVELHKRIAYVMDDGRKAAVEFSSTGAGTSVTVTFDAEEINTEELQRQGWQAILDNFRRYVEG